MRTHTMTPAVTLCLPPASVPHLLWRHAIDANEHKLICGACACSGQEAATHAEQRVLMCCPCGSGLEPG